MAEHYPKPRRWLRAERLAVAGGVLAVLVTWLFPENNWHFFYPQYSSGGEPGILRRLLPAVGVAAAALCFLWASWKATIPSPRRETRILVGVAFLAAAAVPYMLLHRSVFRWTGTRLAPVIATLYGYDLYPTADVGPILPSHGPAGLLTFFPVMIFDTPRAVTIAGQIIAFVISLAPAVVFLVVHSLRHTQNRAMAASTGLSLVLFAVTTPSLVYACLCVHGDAPALGFGTLAVLALMRSDPPQRLEFLLCALAASLAFWSKQTFALLPVVLVAYVLAKYGKRAATRFTCSLLGMGIVVSLSTLLFGTPEQLYFCLFQIMAGEPFVVASLGEFIVGRATPLLREAVPLLTLPAAFWLLHRGREQAPWLGWLRDHGSVSTLFLVVGIAFLPATLVTSLTFGADTNHFASATFFLALGALGIGVMRLPRWAPFLGLACGLSAIGIGIGHGLVPTDRTQQAYQFIKTHPGRAYFPQYPLAHLLAEGRLYHENWMVNERVASGNPVSKAHFDEHIPMATEWLVLEPWGPTYLKDNYFEDFKRQVEVPGLHPFNWVVYARAPPE